MNKRKFFKLVGGLITSTVIPLPQSVPEFKPFGDLYNKFYPTLEGAMSAAIQAEIDREIIISMIRVISRDSTNPLYTSGDVKKLAEDSVSKLQNLDFDIESYKTGYRVITNERKTSLGF